jgi:hypothetical protein
MGKIPGIYTSRTATARQVLLTVDSAVYLAGGKIIDGSQSRDPRNTGDVDVLRNGMILGKRTENDLFAPSIIGKMTASSSATETTLTVSTATGTELDRRIGAGGVFKVVGPPTRGGTVATRACSYSGTAAGGTITLASNSAVQEVQTGTPSAEPASGTYTISYNGETTDAIAYNAAVATIQAALDGLPNVTASDITVSDSSIQSGDAITYTFANTLGNVEMLTHNTALLLNSSAEQVNVTMAETTPGEITGNSTLGATFIADSLIMPADGSEHPLTILADQKYGLQVTEIKDRTTNVDVEFSPLIGGQIKSSQMVDYPDEQSLRTWLKETKLNAANAGRFRFDDDYDNR